MRKLSTPGRMEAFSDGVIAVIVTIMVLEFKVPKQAGLSGALSMLPTLAVYALSFTFTSIYWINHHHMIARLRRVDALILWMNLIFLFFISLIPFFTDYVVQHHFDSFSVALYAGSMMVDGIGFTLLSNSILRHLRQGHSVYDPGEAELALAEQQAEKGKGHLSVAMYLVAIPLAHWSPWLALAITAAITAVWIVPGFMVKPVKLDGTKSETSGA